MYSHAKENWSRFASFFAPLTPFSYQLFELVFLVWHTLWVNASEPKAAERPVNLSMFFSSSLVAEKKNIRQWVDQSRKEKSHSIFLRILLSQFSLCWARTIRHTVHTHSTMVWVSIFMIKQHVRARLFVLQHTATLAIVLSFSLSLVLCAMHHCSVYAYWECLTRCYLYSCSRDTVYFIAHARRLSEYS